MSTRLRAALAAAALSLLGAGALADPAAPDSLTMTPNQARSFAAAMLQQGQPKLAAQLALGLLQRDAGDASAHFLLARAYQHLQQPRAGRRQAALAFRHAKSDTAHFQSAQLAAKLAHDGGQPGLAQLWLRRSWNYAPDETAQKVVMRDYRVLRALNPWNVNLRLSVQPSDNVNNGAEDPYAIVDGLPFVGVLSGDAMALSGLKLTGDLSLGYRLTQSERSQTRLTGQVYFSRVRLSDEARAQAPDARNSDYAYTRAELGLEHLRALGKTRGTISYEAGLSHSWHAGQDHQDTFRLGLGRTLPLGQGQLALQADLEHAIPSNGAPEITRLELRARLSRKLANGAMLSTGLSADKADSDSRNARRQRLSGYVAYALPEKLGPARVSFSLGGAIGQYPDYAVGFFLVPGGREDTTVFGSADFVFENLDYAGFVPSLKIQAQKTRSNVSRFETRELSVSMGIVSRF